MYHEVTETVEAQRLADVRLRELQAVLDASIDPLVVYRPDRMLPAAHNPEGPAEPDPVAWLPAIGSTGGK